MEIWRVANCFWSLNHDRLTKTYDISHISKTSSTSFLTQGPVGPRRAPFWPHDPCYQGIQINQYQLAGWLNTKASLRIIIVANWPAVIFRIVIRYQWRMEVERSSTRSQCCIWHYWSLPRTSCTGIVIWHPRQSFGLVPIISKWSHSNELNL